jgi:hypothetical protein
VIRSSDVNRFGNWWQLKLSSLTLTLLAFGAAACAQTPAAPRSIENARVLFVGNSLTYWNDLPEMVRSIAASTGMHWDVKSVVIGGAALEDHIADGRAPALLASERWDIVILQQGPSTLAESRANLREGAGRFLPLIRASGARAALYMVWPDSTWSASRFSADFDRVRDSYALAAHDVGGWFLPAGEAWRTAWQVDPLLPLYGNDAFHPSPEGTYLAGLAIVAGLSGRSVSGVPGLIIRDGSTLVNVPPALALRMQKAADRAVATYAGYAPSDQP